MLFVSTLRILSAGTLELHGSLTWAFVSDARDKALRKKLSEAQLFET